MQIEISRKLDELVRQGKAVKISKGYPEKILVPFGKYLGIWFMYSSGVHCAAPTLPHEAEELWQVQNWTSLGRGPRRSSYLDAPAVPWHNRAAFDAWRQTGIHKLKREFGWRIDEMATKTGLNERVLTLLFLMTGTRMFEAYNLHPLRFVGNFQGLNFYMLLQLLHQPMKFRWNLIMMCYKMPWRKAVRRLWPRTTPQVLNEITWVNVCRSVNTKIIRWAHEPAPLQAHNAWRHARLTLSPLGVDRPAGWKNVLKQEWLDYSVRYGALGAGKLLEYYRELLRARQDGLRLPQWPNGLPHPDEADRRHTEITRLFSLRNAGGSEELAEQHRQNWAELVVPDGWRPMITREDFVLEGEQMYHCVAGYLNKTSHYFAHLEFNGERGVEKATVELATATLISDASQFPTIRQLLGPCNCVVSEPMRKWVERCLKEIRKPAQTAPSEAA